MQVPSVNAEPVASAQSMQSSAHGPVEPRKMTSRIREETSCFALLCASLPCVGVPSSCSADPRIHRIRGGLKEPQHASN